MYLVPYVHWSSAKGTGQASGILFCFDCGLSTPPRLSCLATSPPAIPLRKLRKDVNAVKYSVMNLTNRMNGNHSDRL